MPVRAARRLAGKVYAYDMLDAPWTGVGRAGLAQKVVRADRERGRYLGLIGFEPMTRTGLHQHLGTAISHFQPVSAYRTESGEVSRAVP